MSELSIPVTSAITTVQVNMQSGTTIYNGSSTNAVWVSTNPSVTPGVGMRIGPKGSVNWTTDNQTCYAVVDTGVTSTVTLTVSTNIRDLVNPVDIGVAVATQLLAQGVPNVFVGNIVASGIALPLITGTTYGLTAIDVSSYASLTITIGVAVEGEVAATFTDVSSGNLGSFDFPMTHISGSATFTIPVTGPHLTLTLKSVSATSSLSYIIYGSNRVVPAPRVLVGYSRNYQYTLSATSFTNNVPVDLTGPFASNGKPVYLRMVVTGAGNKGKFGYYGFNASDVVTGVDLVDSSLGGAGTDGSETEKFINLPPGRLKLYFIPNVTATFTVVISIVQEF